MRRFALPVNASVPHWVSGDALPSLLGSMHLQGEKVNLNHDSRNLRILSTRQSQLRATSSSGPTRRLGLPDGGGHVEARAGHHGPIFATGLDFGLIAGNFRNRKVIDKFRVKSVQCAGGFLISGGCNYQGD